jgi:ribA/ribD-fused uncharacterized protein
MRVVHCKRDRHDVYVGRPSKWGNPFAIGKDGDRAAVIAKYRAWLLSQPALVEDAQRELRGKVLGCWCAPQACHGDVLVEIANSTPKEAPMVVENFKDPPFEFLSNMFPCELHVRGLRFTCSEAVFAAAKCADPADRVRFVGVDGYTAKRLGRQVRLRPDWDAVKVDVMRKVLRLKFAPGSALAQRLLDTGDAELIEGNWWNDRFWGVCKGEGLNQLGKLLMERRAELRASQP